MSGIVSAIQSAGKSALKYAATSRLGDALYQIGGASYAASNIVDKSIARMKTFLRKEKSGQKILINVAAAINKHLRGKILTTWENLINAVFEDNKKDIIRYQKELLQQVNTMKNSIGDEEEYKKFRSYIPLSLPSSDDLINDKIKNIRKASPELRQIIPGVLEQLPEILRIWSLLLTSVANKKEADTQKHATKVKALITTMLKDVGNKHIVEGAKLLCIPLPKSVIELLERPSEAPKPITHAKKLAVDRASNKRKQPAKIKTVVDSKEGWDDVLSASESEKEASESEAEESEEEAKVKSKKRRK